jgi:hypothetical protein
MSDAVGGELPPAVQASFQDADLRGRLSSDNYLVRDQAQAELSSICRRAFGDGPAEDQGAVQMGLPSNVISSEMMRPSPAAPMVVEGGAIPPAAEHYIVPQAFKGSDVEAAFRSWCADGEFTQDEAVGVAAALDRFDREGTDVGEWPEHIRAARLKLLEESYQATPEGQRTLAMARSVFAEMRRAAPDLARLLDEAGATSDPGVIWALAGLARR